MRRCIQGACSTTVMQMSSHEYKIELGYMYYTLVHAISHLHIVLSMHTNCIQHHMGVPDSQFSPLTMLLGLRSFKAVAGCAFVCACAPRLLGRRRHALGRYVMGTHHLVALQCGAGPFCLSHQCFLLASLSPFDELIQPGNLG